jgi:hypothetical protein
MKMLRSILPHIVVIISGIFMTFLVLDGYNPTMEFVGNPVSLKLLWAFCILSILNSVIIIASNRKKWRKSTKN